MASADATTRAAIVQRGYDSFSTGDMDTMRSLLAEDVSWYSPSQGSGEFHGIDAVIGEFGRIFQDSGGTFRVTVNEILTGDDSVVVLARASGTRGDKTLDSPYAHIFSFSGEKISAAWVISYDQAEAAAFWA